MVEVSLYPVSALIPYLVSDPWVFSSPLIPDLSQVSCNSDAHLLLQII